MRRRCLAYCCSVVTFLWMRYEPIPVEDVRPHLANLLRALRKAGLDASIEENKPERGQVLLTIGGHAAPFRVIKSYSVVLLDLVCPLFGRREIHLAKRGDVDTGKVVEAVAFHFDMQAAHERQQAGAARLAELEARYGLTHGSNGDGDPVRCFDVQDRDGKAKTWVDVQACVTVETVAKVLELLAAEGVIRSAQ